MYSESWMKCSRFTMSASDLTERFPLVRAVSTGLINATKRSLHVFLRCIWVNEPFARL